MRRGFRRIEVGFKVRGDEPDELAQLVEQARKRSAVFDILTNGAPIDIEVDAALRATPPSSVSLEDSPSRYGLDRDSNRY